MRKDGVESIAYSPDMLLEYILTRAQHIHDRPARLTHVKAFRFRLEVGTRFYEGTLQSIAHRLLSGDVGIAIPVPECRITVMRSGAYVHYLEPHRTPIRLYDLEWHMNHAFRYNNTRQVSVLFHTALVIRLGFALGYTAMELAHAALHDMSEAYLGEDPGGKKDAVPELKRLEDLWDARIFDRFGFPWPMDDETHRRLKVLDHRALVVEMSLFNHVRQPNVEADHGGPATHREWEIGRALEGLDAFGLWKIVTTALDCGGAKMEDDG